MEQNNLKRTTYFLGHCSSCKYQQLDSEEFPCSACGFGNTHYVKNNVNF